MADKFVAAVFAVLTIVVVAAHGAGDLPFENAVVTLLAFLVIATLRRDQP